MIINFLNIISMFYIIATLVAGNCKKQHCIRPFWPNKLFNKKIKKLMKNPFQQFIAVPGIISYNY